MPRKNTTYAEKHGPALRDGNLSVADTAAPKEPENELDSQDVQDAILNPPVETIKTWGGEIVELKTEFTLNDIVKQKVHNVLANFVRVVAFEVAKMTQDTNIGSTTEETSAWYARNAFYLLTVLDKPAVASVLADALSLLSGKPAHWFEVLDNANGQKAANLLFRLFAKESEGNSKPKN